MNLLVTGGAGFIGSNFVKYILCTYPIYKVVNLDLLTYAGNLNNLKDVMTNSNHVFIEGDIRDEKLINSILREHHINVIINFAAESHVDNSIKNPNIFVETNVLGTLNLLNCVKSNDRVKYIQISTDEVYGSLEETGYFTETTALSPRSPYSASKASADLLVLAYFETYGIDVNITRCSNNYGPYQHPEKLIPKSIFKCINGENIPVYGSGENIRDWLHVYDHCEAIDLVLHKGLPGEIYNIGGNNEKTNNEVVDLLLSSIETTSKKKYVEDRLGHDYRYAIDATKIKSQLDWKPKYNFESGIKQTIQWYLKNKEWLAEIK